MDEVQSSAVSPRIMRPGSMTRVYLFSPIPYFFLHQRPQKMTEEFGKRGISVVYVEPSGWREYLQRQRRGLLGAAGRFLWCYLSGLIALLVRKRHARSQPAPSGSPQTAVPDRIVLPLLVPHNRFDSPLLERINASVYREFLWTKVFRHRLATEKSLALVNNPFWGLVLDKDMFSAVYYDCIDELSIYSGRASPQRFRLYEKALAEMSRAAFATSHTLESEITGLYPDLSVTRVPNGVDAEWFRQKAADTETPADIRNITPPRVGYIGALYPWIDTDLLRELGETLPEISLVLIGPSDDNDRLGRLRQRRNIHWMGVKPYSDVPSCVASCDVCLIPFQTGPVSRTTNPVKLYEYFALGKPVVTTPLTDLEQYAAAGLVIMGTTRSEFIEGVRRALAESDPSLRTRRMEVAREHSWKRHAERMLQAMEISLRPSSSTLSDS